MSGPKAAKAFDLDMGEDCPLSVIREDKFLRPATQKDTPAYQKMARRW